MPPQKMLLTILVLIAIPSVLLAQHDMTLQPYMKLGYLASGPNASDLGYAIIGGSDADSYIDTKKINYGAGMQILFPFDGLSSTSMDGKIGFDIGLQKLFSSKFDPGNSGGFITQDYDEESEYETYILGVLQMTSTSSPLILQGGIGLHFVFWSWERNYSSIYSSSYGSESGTGTNLGLFVAGGLNLSVSEKMKLPLMLRIDHIFRYGSTMTISAMAGLTINLD